MQETLNLQIGSFKYYRQSTNYLMIHIYYLKCQKISEIKKEKSEWAIIKHFLDAMNWAYHSLYIHGI